MRPGARSPQRPDPRAGSFHNRAGIIICIDGDRRHPAAQTSGDPSIEIAKLRIAIGMDGAFAGFSIRLQTVAVGFE